MQVRGSGLFDLMLSSDTFGKRRGVVCHLCAILDIVGVGTYSFFITGMIGFCCLARLCLSSPSRQFHQLYICLELYWVRVTLYVNGLSLAIHLDFNVASLQETTLQYHKLLFSDLCWVCTSSGITISLFVFGLKSILYSSSECSRFGGTTRISEHVIPCVFPLKYVD